jgi:hypothetical protein
VISKYLASDGQRINVARMNQRGDMREVFVSMVGQPRDSSFDVSNLGVVWADEGVNGTWKMGRCGFSRTAFAAGGVSRLRQSRGVMGVCVWGLAGRRGLLRGG